MTMTPRDTMVFCIPVSVTSCHCMFCSELPFIASDAFIDLKKVLLYFPQGEAFSLEAFQVV
jgi:hypothetical protein